MDKMDFKQNRETFSSNCIILESSCEQAVERDFVLPDYYPDIFRVLKCCVYPRVVSSSINGDKLSFELSVVVRVLYQTEGSGKINCIEQKMSYSKSVDMSGSCQNILVKIVPRTDYVNCRVVNQRRLDVRGAVTCAVKVTGEKKQAVVVDAFGGNIQLKKSVVTYPSKRLTASKRITIIEELEIAQSKPKIDTVLKSSCIAFPQEQKIIAGKLVTKGELEISVLYTSASEDNSDTAEVMKYTLPYSQIIDVEGIDEGYEANADIVTVDCEAMPKGDNDTLECEIMMQINCTAVKYETCEIVTDAYSICYECEIEKSSCRLEGMPSSINESHTSEAKLVYNDENIHCVYDVQASVDNVSSRYDSEGKKFVISGNVCFSLLGKNDSNCPIYIETDTPFEHDIPISENCVGENSTVDPKVCVKTCSYHLSDSNTADVTAELQIGGYLYESCAKTIISDLKVLMDKPKSKEQNYALKLCYCEDNEDIWEIAKKYSTSVIAIMEENNLESDKAVSCGMLLIPLMN